MNESLPELDFGRLGPRPGARIVLVGGCGGLGLAVMKACVAIDLRVAVLDLASSLEARALPAEVEAIALDIKDEASVTAAFADLHGRWEGAEGLVNFVGYTGDLDPAEQIETATLDELLAGNLRGTFLSSREGLKLLRAGPGGAIVNTSTGIANVGNPGYSAYAASKAGVNALSRVMATEVAPDIRVNAIAPGAVDTAFIRGGFGRGGSEEGPPARIDIERYNAMVPAGRIGVADDIVGAYLFLLSDAARYITGQVLHVNGGALMRD